MGTQKAIAPLAWAAQVHTAAHSSPVHSSGGPGYCSGGIVIPLYG